MKTTIVAIDLAKSVFEVAVADHHWRLVARHRLRRAKFQRFLDSLSEAHVIMEACSSSHYWGRLLLQRGHQVSLLPPVYVRPYVRRHKTDRADAEALLEAARCGRIPPVPVKSVEQQEILALHRLRSQWVRARTARINAMRAYLHEHGVIMPRGARTALRTIPGLLDAPDTVLPARHRHVMRLVLDEVHDLEKRIHTAELLLRDVASTHPVVPRLLQIPGIGLLTATALVGAVGNIHTFSRSRQFASWLGLTPREHSSGDSRHLGRITKRGDVYLRCLLTHGARAVLRVARLHARAGKPTTHLERWALTIQLRCGHNKAVIAVANKLARTVWAVWRYDQAFDPHPSPRGA